MARRYRIREKVCLVCSGLNQRYERRFIAEYELKWFLPISVWIPVINFDWRATYNEAVDDMDNDIGLRSPMSDTVVYKVEERGGGDAT